MNRDDIIRMAREAGFAPPDGLFITWGASNDQIQRFAALVAAAEREACWDAAGIALLGADLDLTKRVLQAIRARGEKK